MGIIILLKQKVPRRMEYFPFNPPLMIRLIHSDDDHRSVIRKKSPKVEFSKSDFLSFSENRADSAAFGNSVTSRMSLLT